jgi:hypothetical protein
MRAYAPPPRCPPANQLFFFSAPPRAREPGGPTHSVREVRALFRSGWKGEWIYEQADICAPPRAHPTMQGLAGFRILSLFRRLTVT